MTGEPGTTRSTEGDSPGTALARLWRGEAPFVLAALLRRHGDYGDCEDAVQEAAEAAVRQWPRTGTPADPRAWLIRVASRRLIDRVRADSARTRREEEALDDGARIGAGTGEPGQDAAVAGGQEADQLRLLLLCAHPALTRSSQVCLCLRAVAGLSVAQIATGFGVPARTMTQRLTRARSPARTDPAGDLVPLAEQDRSRWRTDLIARGRRLLEPALGRGHVGRFQLEAAIAAVHADAPTYAETDWLQISVLYDLLSKLVPSQTVTLNHAVAVAMAHGAHTGLLMIDPLLTGPGGVQEHRVHAVRAHLLELAGETAAAAESYRQAARLTTSLPEQRYLLRRLAALTGD